MKPQVLVLDDDDAVCRILSRILGDQRYAVHTSRSVGEAKTTITQQNFDAYLLDYRLQDGTGLDVAEHVRKEGSEAPIIMISGYGAPELTDQAGALNLFEVIEKPFSRDKICDSLAKAIGSKETLTNSAAPMTSTPEKSSDEDNPSRSQNLGSLLIWFAIILAVVTIVVVLFMSRR